MGKINKLNHRFLEFLDYSNISISKAIRKKILKSSCLKKEFSLENSLEIQKETRENILVLLDKFFLNEQNAEYRDITERFFIYDQIAVGLNDKEKIPSEQKEQLLSVKSTEEIKQIGLSPSLENKAIKTYKLYCETLKDNAKKIEIWKKENPEKYDKFFNEVISEKDLLKQLFHAFIGLSHILNEYSNNSDFELFKNNVINIAKKSAGEEMIVSRKDTPKILEECLFKKLNQYNKDAQIERENRQLTKFLIDFYSDQSHYY